MDLTIKFSELSNQADKILNNIYYQRNKLIIPTKGLVDNRYNCLKSNDLNKIRQKLIKSYPNTTDILKIANYELFKDQADDIELELKPFRLLIEDIITFTLKSKELLYQVSSNVLDFKIEKNRNISIIFFELLSYFIKVVWIFSRLDEKKLLFSLSEAAIEALPKYAVNNQFSPSSEISKFLSDLDNVHAYLIQTFWSIHSFLKPIVVQLKDSLEYCDDFDALREIGVFNLLKLGVEGLSIYSMDTISSMNGAQVYTELRDYTKYKQYVLFSCLVCPVLIPDNDILDMFKLVMKSTIFINLYRDMLFNVHLEFEYLSTIYPLANDSNLSILSTSQSTSIPNGFKINKILKDLSRVCISTYGNKSNDRKLFLLNELIDINRIVTTLPSVLGPKINSIATIAALCKHEILDYLYVYKYLNNKNIRKDSRKYFDRNEYIDNNNINSILPLFSELITLMNHVDKHKSIITTYLIEYLVKIDYKKIKQLTSRSIQQSNNESLSSYFNPIILNIETLVSKINQIDAEVDSYTDVDMSNVLNYWDEFIYFIYSKNMYIVSKNYPAFSELSIRMSLVYERAKYIHTEKLINDFIDCRECYWFNDSLIQLNKNILNGSNPQDIHYTRCIYTYLRSINQLSNHSKEIDVLMSTIQLSFDQTIYYLSTYILDQIKINWSHYQALENQITSTEVIRRLEKILTTSHIKGTAIEPLPGSESEIWAKQSIYPLSLSTKRISSVLAMIRRVDTEKIVVYNKQYNLTNYLSNNITHFLEEQLVNLLSLSISQFIVPRVLSNRLHSLILSCQGAFISLGLNIHNTLQSLLFKETCDLTIYPPGIPVTLTNKIDRNNKDRQVDRSVYTGTLLWKLIDWFTFIHTTILSSSSLVWIPSIHSIITYNSNSLTNKLVNYLPIDSKNNAVMIESFLSKLEMETVVKLIGIQGIRALELELFYIIIEKSVKIKEILFQCRSELIEISEDASKISTIYLLIKDRISPAFDLLRDIGLLLSIREIIHSAKESSLSMYSPSLSAITRNACESISPYSDIKLTHPIYSLAADCGYLHHVDIALTSALANYLNNPSDRYLWNQLPILGACVYLDDRFKKSVFISDYQAYQRNEHAIQLALSKMFTCCYINNSIDNDVEETASQSSRPSSKATTKRVSTIDISTSFTNDQVLRNQSLVYLQTSVTILLSIKGIANYSSLFSTLELFVQLSPWVYYSDLNDLVPAILLHRCIYSSKDKPGRSSSIVSIVSSNKRYSYTDEGNT